MNRTLLKRRLVEQQEEAQLLVDQELVKREKQKELLEMLDIPLVKVIMGPRRSGKTVLSLQSQVLKERDYCYINFDDELLGTVRGDELNVLLELAIELYGEQRHLVLDEIQDIEKWELFVNRLLRANYNIILTGSNSKLLSKELSSALTGRSLTLELLPFSFSEYLAVRGKSADPTETTGDIGKMRGNLRDYIREGGFPEVLMKFQDEKYQRKYLRELFDATISRDVAHRHHIRYRRELVECANVLISNFGRKTSSRKLAKEIGISDHTLKRYSGFLEDAYLLMAVKKYAFKPLEIEKSMRKYYSIDTGYIHAKGLNVTVDFGFLMENLVAVELKRRGLEFYYYMLNDRIEIDFVIRRNRKITEVIQVTYDESGIRDREVSHGLEAAKKLNAAGLTVITWYHENEETKDGITFKYVPLWKWLLNI